MNPRNTASGSLKMQDSGEVRKRGLSAVLYQYIAENFPAETHWDLLADAKQWGFRVSEDQAKLCRTLDDVKISSITGIRKDIPCLLRLMVLL